MARLDWNRIQTELAEVQSRLVVVRAPDVAGPGIADGDWPTAPRETHPCATAPEIARWRVRDHGADHSDDPDALLDHIALALAEDAGSASS